VDGTENVFTLLINYVLRLDATIGMNEEERCDKTLWKRGHKRSLGE
jgi:hypothetical protein